MRGSWGQVLETRDKSSVKRVYKAQWGRVLESWNKKEEKRSENFVKDL